MAQTHRTSAKLTMPLADHLDVVNLAHHQRDLAVIDQQPIPLAGIGNKPGIRGRDPIRGADHVGDGHPHLVPGVPVHRAHRKPPQPDLGSWQVGEDRHRPSGLVAGLADQRRHPRMLSMGTVAEVQPRDVHPRAHQPTDALRGRRRRPHRAHDLRASRHGTHPSQPPTSRRPSNRETTRHGRTPQTPTHTASQTSPPCRRHPRAPGARLLVSDLTRSAVDQGPDTVLRLALSAW
jgi:hypothetical protein